MVAIIPVRTVDPAVGGDARAVLANLPGGAGMTAASTIRRIAAGISAAAITHRLSRQAAAGTVDARHAG